MDKRPQIDQELRTARDVTRGGRNQGEDWNMMIEARKQDLSALKEVKVKIPVSHHIKLHSMKVLTGKQISDAVTEALEIYFATQQKNAPTLVSPLGVPVTGTETGFEA